MNRLLWLLMGGFLVAWHEFRTRTDTPPITQRREAWKHFPKEIEEEQRRRLALCADERKAS